MEYNIINFLNKISDTENYMHDDELTELISEETEDELSLFDLDLVSAAAMPDFDKFNLYLKDNNKID